MPHFKSTSAALRARRLTLVATCAAFVAVLGLALPGAALARHRAAGRHGCRNAGIPIRRTSIVIVRRAVLCLVNVERRMHGLPRLHELHRLDRTAQTWTNTMLARRTFSHSELIGARIASAGYRWSVIGENIATGYSTSAQVVRAWMASPDHCRNILDPRFRNLGTGMSRSPVFGGTFGHGTWTLDLGLRAGARPASRNWAPAEGCPY